MALVFLRLVTLDSEYWTDTSGIDRGQGYLDPIPAIQYCNTGFRELGFQYSEEEAQVEWLAANRSPKSAEKMARFHE